LAWDVDVRNSFEAWTKAPDDGYNVNSVYLDYRKAFDRRHNAGLD